MAYLTTYYIYAPHSSTPVVQTHDYGYVQEVLKQVKGSTYTVQPRPSTTKV